MVEGAQAAKAARLRIAIRVFISSLYHARDCICTRQASGYWLRDRYRTRLDKGLGLVYNRGMETPQKTITQDEFIKFVNTLSLVELEALRDYASFRIEGKVSSVYQSLVNTWSP